MSFKGYLLKVGGVELPLKFIRYETYKITPDQRMDLDTTRVQTGELVRTVLAHTATKVEFETPSMNNIQQAELMKLLRDSWVDAKERKVNVEYYDMETDGYKTGVFYMPDISWTIRNIDQRLLVINYNQTRIAFIEY